MRTVFNCCYIELHLKCDRAARSDSETWINLDQGKKVFHPPFPSLKSAKKRTRTMCQIYSKLTIDTRTASGASIVNFENSTLCSTVIVVEFVILPS